MLTQATKVFELFFEDAETSIACFSGSITEAIVHPQKIKKLIVYFIKAAIAGYLLATFVSPAVAEKFKLTKKEAVAASFICGYAGIRILSNAEKLIEAKLKKRIKDEST